MKPRKQPRRSRVPISLPDEQRASHVRVHRRKVLPASEEWSLYFFCADIMDGTLQGISILVVEDDDDTRELLTVLLETQGGAVTAVPSVQAALTSYDRSRPDVIVADIGMPDYNGYTLIGRVRAKDRGKGSMVPAIALTAFATAIDRDTVLSAGFQVHMPKPFEPDRLISVIAELTSKYPCA